MKKITLLMIKNRIYSEFGQKINIPLLTSIDDHNNMLHRLPNHQELLYGIEFVTSTYSNYAYISLREIYEKSLEEFT